MNRKIILIGFVCIFCINLSVFNVACNASSESSDFSLLESKKEITIRNVTDRTVHYSIKPLNSNSKPVKRTLKVGVIDRFPGKLDMEVTFNRNGERIVRQIDPGPYSFRYDENDELELYVGSHGRADAVDLAPFIPTPMIVVEKMLEMVKIDKNDVLYDLGCGDGRIVIKAAKEHGTRGVGIDIDSERIKESKANAEEAGVEKLVQFRLGDVTEMDFSEATVVTMYLLEESNELLRPLLEKYLKPGTYVISHNYPIPGWEDKEIDIVTLQAEDDEEHDIYIYQR